MVEICKLPKKGKNRKRITVITCGPDPAIITEYDFSLEKMVYLKHSVPHYVSEEDIVDTNGAGDAFSGGFLAALVLGQDLDKCTYMGHWAASLIIKTRGCQLLAEYPLKLKKTNVTTNDEKDKKIEEIF